MQISPPPKWFWLFGALSCICVTEANAQDAIVLETVENTAEYNEIPVNSHDDRLEHATTISIDDQSLELSKLLDKVTSARIADSGNRLQRKSFAFRGAAAQDIVIRYLNIPLNALSDASADLALIPAQLIQNAKVFGSGAAAANGAVGGLVDLQPNLDAPMRTQLSVSTMNDFSLFSQGKIHPDNWQISGAFWGDSSPGNFQYYDEQGTLQTREHNAASRIGGQLFADIALSSLKMTAFSLLSYIDREEAGQSEYPAKYRDASQKLWLSLSSINTEFAPFSLGKSLVQLNLSASERLSGDIYDNPTSFVGGTHTYSDYLESRTILDTNGIFLLSDWSRTSIDFTYEYQYLTSEMLVFDQTRSQNHSRHLISASIIEGLSFFQDRLELAVSGRLDWNVDTKSPLFSYHAGVTGQPFKELSLWASASMAERYPTFDESYYRTEYIRGNSSLATQRSYIHELGIAYSPAQWFKTSITGFYNLHEDLIRFIPVTPYLFEAKNISGATARGLEVSVSSSGWYGFSAKAEYTLADVITDDGYPMPTTAKHHVMGELSWKNRHLITSVDIHYQSKVPRNMTGTDFSRSKLRLNAHFAMNLYDTLWLSLDIDNMLNDMSSADVLQRPLPGIQAFVNLRWTDSSRNYD
ncbi:MAG: TonB-dependent receptor [Proteobacteria bacterium]|nr:TonB-dependent receptor [Pseudomonadota bacterium]